jgi:teichuronic acid exporter
LKYDQLPDDSRFRLTDSPDGFANSVTGPVSPGSVRRRARIGVAALAVRSSAQLVLSLAAMLILAGLMKPADFGVFAIIQFAVTLLSLFGDAGFGPALIRQKTAPTQREFATVWWTQMALAVLVVAALLLCSTVIRGIWTDLPPVSEPLLRAMALSFVFNTLRVMPTIQLERELRFVSLAVIELLASVAYFGTAVGVAYFSRDVTALVYAVIVQSLVACTLAYVVRPWRPTFEFDWSILRSIARYGFAYQGNLLIGFANNAVTPFLLGIVLGKVALGLNGFAQTLAWLPLRLVEIFGRVGYPLYSSMRDDRIKLANELRFNVHVCALVTALFSCLLLVLGGPLVEFAYGAKWQPAIPLMKLYATVILLGFLSPIASSMFYALGRPGLVFRLALGWTALNWVVVGAALYVRPTLEVYALAYCVHIVVGNLIVLALLRQQLPHVGIVRSVVSPGLVTVFVGLVGQRVLALEQNPWVLALGGVMSCAALAGLVIAFDRSVIGTVRALFGVQQS